jgi:hypothetical protein
MTEATLYWIVDNQPFATLKVSHDGIYIWEWLITNPQGVMDRFFKTSFFCTNCGEKETDSLVAAVNTGTQYSISQLQNLFFNCGIIIHKMKQ